MAALGAEAVTALAGRLDRPDAVRLLLVALALARLPWMTLAIGRVGSAAAACSGLALVGGSMMNSICRFHEFEI